MSSQEYNAQDLHMGLSVYSSDGEKVGTLRFAMTIPDPPYTVKYILVDRIDGIEGAMLTEASAIESVNFNSLSLNIKSDAFYELPPFNEEEWFSQHTAPRERDMRDRDQRPMHNMMRNRGRRQQDQRRPHYGSKMHSRGNY